MERRRVGRREGREGRRKRREGRKERGKERGNEGRREGRKERKERRREGREGGDGLRSSYLIPVATAEVPEVSSQGTAGGDCLPNYPGGTSRGRPPAHGSRGRGAPRTSLHCQD